MIGYTNESLQDIPVANPDPWYPSLNVMDWQEAYRIPGTAPLTLQRQLMLALYDVNDRLAEWQADQLEAGVALLPAELEDDYTEAIYARAFALLIPMLPSVITDERAREEIAQLQQQPGDFLARAEARLARVTGKTAGTGRLKAVLI